MLERYVALHKFGTENLKNLFIVENMYALKLFMNFAKTISKMSVRFVKRPKSEPLAAVLYASPKISRLGCTNTCIKHFNTSSNNNISTGSLEKRYYILFNSNQLKICTCDNNVFEKF